MIALRPLGRLPLRLLYVFAAIAHRLLYHVLRYRRSVVQDNLAQAFPELPDVERQRLERRFYRQLTDVAAEILRARYMPREEFARRVQVVNPDLVKTLSENEQRSVLIVTIHQGNWEWLSHAASTALGTPLDPVYKPLHSAGANKFILELRSRFGARPMPVKSAARDILRHRDHFRLLTLVADQSPIRVERTLWTEFFSRETAFNPGVETLARLTGFPVVFARCQRLRRGHYRLEFLPLAEPPYDEIPVDDITLRYVALAEQAIRAEPASWLWSNRRWKGHRGHNQDKDQD